MARLVFLHVGTPKSATTYIQDSLWSNRKELRALGLQMPLAHQLAHWRVGMHARSLGVDGGREFPVEFGRFLSRTEEWDGDILLTTEILCALGPKQTKLFVDLIKADEVHVIITARDFVRQVTAEWQQHIRGGSIRPLEDFVSDIKKRDPNLWFWRVQDIDAIAARWAEAVPAHRIHLVTVPKTSDDPELVWKRFCSVVGVDPNRVPPRVDQSNVSLGYLQAESLRRIALWRIKNGVTHNGDRPALYHSAKFLAPLRELRGSKIQIPLVDQEWAKSVGEEMSAGIKSRGVSVVGSMDDLQSSVAPSQQNPELTLDSFVDIVSPLLHETLLRLERAENKVKSSKVEWDLTKANLDLKAEMHLKEISRRDELIAELRHEIESRSTIRGGLSTVKRGIGRRLRGLFRRSAV